MTTALVTGAASGIGRATAIRLAADGFNVAVADINVAGLEETVQTIEATGSAVLPIVTDVSEPDQCRSLPGTAAQWGGSLDVVCNIAGILRAGRVEAEPIERWDLMVAINLSAVFHICAAAAPLLVDSKGSIVNLASVAGTHGQAYTASYCATKGGVVALTKALAVELSDRDVRVNCVTPGGVDTPMVASFELPDDANPALLAPMAPLIPSLARPEEIAAMISYLCSADARFVTGAVFAIDGGQGTP